MLHYRDAAEAIEDKDRLVSLLNAADITYSSLRRDRCGQWIIQGKRGHAFCDGKVWLIYAGPPDGGEAAFTKLAWTWAKKRLKDFAVVTQDGDDEGVFRLDALPSPEQAEELRDVIGFRKRAELSPENLERLRQRGASLSQGNRAPFGKTSP